MCCIPARCPPFDLVSGFPPKLASAPRVKRNKTTSGCPRTEYGRTWESTISYGVHREPKQLPSVHAPTLYAMVLHRLRCIGRRRRDLWVSAGLLSSFMTP